jgi:hypothetical protein
MTYTPNTHEAIQEVTTEALDIIGDLGGTFDALVKASHTHLDSAVNLAAVLHILVTLADDEDYSNEKLRHAILNVEEAMDDDTLTLFYSEYVLDIANEGIDIIYGEDAEEETTEDDGRCECGCWEAEEATPAAEDDPWDGVTDKELVETLLALLLLGAQPK